MEEKIKKHLVELEQQKNLKILMAVESGSRAWGFPSPDSDYDVRIVYIKKIDWYLSIAERKDTIDYFHGKLLDINGWDIRKTLRLLKKSNATPFEWAQSPIVYFEEEGFRNEIINLANQYFQPYHTLNHYKGIAKNSLSNIQGNDEIKLKKLFYVIRPVLAINWILARQTIPPMDIFSLMEVIKDVEIKTKINELIRLKETVNESYFYYVEPKVKQFIEEQFMRLEATTIQKDKEIPETKLLDEFYRRLLKQYGK